ncbi:hypothetical protein BU24DRAFT_408991 [Aaosphaeria arxii CBS 175.79]|uniref:Rhodopsin domain-containing protein n=1 Tax=Aaosphaeria arxii CBS 175.79 TaxID=1450172 RepID=A0A6A5XSM2_9PLEO|nr:uncharacterized protein BU24DRAFT_408991 [Aaosphaeria arxii CBS 175.79]KAF2015807.1 hypothetical protein BU24DRAFT_408991 [Aaosphaeria arxii CBS 175.79]
MAPRTLQPSGLVLVFLPSIVSTLVVILRIWKKVTSKHFAIEDVLLIIAQSLIFILAFTTWRSFKVSWYGYHYYDVPPGAKDIILILKWNYVNAVIYNPILGLIKASFVLTLIKLRSPNQRINYCLWAIFAINAVFTVAAPLVCAFQCKPVARFWNKSLPGSCLDGPSYAYGTIGIVLITDVMVVIMPTWILYNLQMPIGKKLMMISFLSFGLAVTAIGAYRLYVFHYLYNGFTKNPDSAYSVRQGLSNLEVSLASIGACGGTIKWMLGLCMPFFASEDSRIAKSKRSDRSNSSRERDNRHTPEPDLITTDGDDMELRDQPEDNHGPVWKKVTVRSRNRPTSRHETPDVEVKPDDQSSTTTRPTEWDASSKASTMLGKDTSSYERRQTPRRVI